MPDHGAHNAEGNTQHDDSRLDKTVERQRQHGIDDHQGHHQTDHQTAHALTPVGLSAFKTVSQA